MKPTSYFFRHIIFSNMIDTTPIKQASDDIKRFKNMGDIEGILLLDDYIY